MSLSFATRNNTWNISDARSKKHDSGVSRLLSEILCKSGADGDAEGTILLTSLSDKICHPLLTNSIILPCHSSGNTLPIAAITVLVGIVELVQTFFLCGCDGGDVIVTFIIL